MGELLGLNYVSQVADMSQGDDLPVHAHHHGLDTAPQLVHHVIAHGVNDMVLLKLPGFLLSAINLVLKLLALDDQAN